MQNKFHSFFLLSLFSISSLSMFAQDDKLISDKKLRKDIEQLVGLMEAHPDPYTHISEAAFNAKVKEVKASINEPMSELDFFKKASSLIALMKDGHSSASLPEFWMKNKRKELGGIPYEVYLTNEDKLFLIKDYQEKGIPPGSEITSINGIGVSEFLDKIDQYISYELKAFRNTIIDNDFEKYLYVAFGKADETELGFTTAGGEENSVTMNNMPYKEWKKYQKDNKKEADKKIGLGRPYDFEILEDGIAKINIYAFSASDVSAYEVFLDESFKDIKKQNIHSLIIDVRGNYGGWPKISSYLFHYITESYFKTMALSTMKVSQTYKDILFEAVPELQAYQNQIHIPVRTHYVNLNSILNGKAGSFVHEESFFNEPPRTENHEFTGTVYLLTNRDSYSAASSFASTFQCYQMGEIIGEETGGTKVFRANSVSKYLNKSKVWVSISSTLLLTACYNEDLQGVTPNHNVVPTVEDMVNEKDTQLIFTKDLIKKAQDEKED